MRADVVAEARRWIGTPYHHQAHERGVGCDCAGLVAGVAVALGLVPRDFWQVHGHELSGYGRDPVGERLLDVLRRFMTEVAPESAAAGDVLALRFRRLPQHLAIVVPHVAGGAAIVHAIGSGPGAVVEHRLDEAWRRRTVAAFRYPGGR